MACAVMQSEEQKHLRSLTKDAVAETVKLWFDDGAPLSLDLEGFSTATSLPSDLKQQFFDMFDTDHNQRVDALEVLSAMALFADASLEEKADIILPMFDFSGVGQMSFDEANILLHSTCRGLQKVCAGTQSLAGEEVVKACEQLFDSYNVPYNKTISNDQTKRWIKSDVDVARYLNCYHRSIVLSEAFEELDRLGQQQEKILGELSRDAKVSLSVESVLRERELMETLGNPPEWLAKAIATAAVELAGAGTARNSALPSSFASAFAAWNVFHLVDIDLAGEVSGGELKTLLWLQSRKEPSTEMVLKKRTSMDLAKDARISASEWIKGKAQHKPTAKGGGA